MGEPSNGAAGRGRRRDWTELPEKAAESIFRRLGAIEVLENAQKVCMKWRRICKNNTRMWRTIDMRNDGDLQAMDYDLEVMCRHAVDRSRGELVDINIEHFGTDRLLHYITDSSRGIRRLRLLCCNSISDEGLGKVAQKLPLLEELDISLCGNISHEAVQVVGRSCPLLKSFKLNKEWCIFSNDEPYAYHFGSWYSCHCYREKLAPFPFKDDYNGVAFAIAGTMGGLRHLQLFGNKLTNDGLRNILDSCPHLCSLDLRHCFILNLDGDLGRICAERIEKLWLPHDSTEGKEFVARSEGYCFKWTELPDNITRSILSRLGAIEILATAQKVCSKWFYICKDPLMWRTIDMHNKFDISNYRPFYLHDLCEDAIDRSCGNLVDINVENFGTNFLLDYLAERSRGLKRLRLVGSHRITDEGFRKVASKFPMLEHLDITLFEDISHETLALVGRSCPLLKSFKFNKQWFRDDCCDKAERNDCAFAIAGTMHGLHHLMLFRNQLSNKGRRCAERIQKLWLPQDSIDDIDPSYDLDAEW
ncbi:F-box/LRR-repeat protein 4 isoform X2 [Rosa chinensis]|uniref:F-box/LRR-repeat protein 4 isoform X2 n=1 Tax=Rosa chinensis TaxID=74649 RepID=UPI001AD93160|nr:F-box/LRR-repeat protein 4 isoform X2 [Rosa chinensis]